jgi:plasmid stabilization system protein ParE
VKRGLRSIQQASDEFTEAVRWYEKRRPGLGGEFFDAVCATMALIEARPEIGTVVGFNVLNRRALVPRFPYQVVYRLTPSEIVIVAVGHLKRRPAYWRNRP